jgi:hypothetical protein
MNRSLPMKVLSVVAVCVVLAHLYPLATGTLLCLEEGADPGCCTEPDLSRLGVGETEQVQDGSDWDCCIAVDAVPTAEGATSPKASLEVLSGSGRLRDAGSPRGAGSSRAGSHHPGDSRLCSLRSVVLLI